MENIARSNLTFIVFARNKGNRILSRVLVLINFILLGFNEWMDEWIDG